MVLTLVLLQALAQTDGGSWAATIADEAQGERVVTALVTPLPPPNEARLVLTLPDGTKRTRDFELDTPGITAAIREALEQGPATLFVLILDTKLSIEAGRRSLAASAGLTCNTELRFAGPTRVKGQPMPEVLGLVKFAPPAPPLSQTQIRGVFQAAYGEIRGCYQRQLEANALEGRLVAELNVGPDGKVNGARIVSSQIDAIDVERCISDVLRTLRFPKPRGAPMVQVIWPFVFKKGSDKTLPPIPK